MRNDLEFNCPDCGTKNDEGAKFCKECGLKFEVNIENNQQIQILNDTNINDNSAIVDVQTHDSTSSGLKTAFKALGVLIFITLLYVLFFVPFSDNSKQQNSNINESNDVSNNTNESYRIMGTNLIENKYYFLVGTTTGKRASISFKNNGTCSPMFSGLNNNSKRDSDGSYFMIVYESLGSCHYTVNNDGSISINWDGLVETQYHFKTGYGYSTSTINSSYIMKDIIVKEGTNNSIVAINGNWDLQQLDGAFILSFKVDDKKNSSDDQNDNSNSNSNNNVVNNSVDNNNNTSIDSNVNNNNEKESINKAEKEAEGALESITSNVFFKDATYDYYNVETCIPSYYHSRIKEYIKEYSINGVSQTIDPNAMCSGKINYPIENTGEYCVEVKIVNTYNKERVIKRCTNFQPIAPKFDVKVTSFNGSCFVIETLNFGYNTLENVEVYINGVLASESTEIRGWKKPTNVRTGYLYADPGTYTIKLVNKYGLSSEETVLVE